MTFRSWQDCNPNSPWINPPEGPDEEPPFDPEWESLYALDPGPDDDDTERSAA